MPTSSILCEYSASLLSFPNLYFDLWYPWHHAETPRVPWFQQVMITLLLDAKDRHSWIDGAFVMVGPSPGLSPYPYRVNVGCGPAEERVLLTGLHAVADIHCENCKTTLGWKYVSQ